MALNRNAAMLWMMNNQLGRRNLNDFQRVEIVRKCENAIKAQAGKRRLSTLKQNQDTDKVNLPERAEQSRDTLGAMAKVSGRTYDRATAVMDKAPEEVIQAVSLHYSRMCPTFGRVSNGLIPGQKTALNRNARCSASPNKACISSWAALW